MSTVIPDNLFKEEKKLFSKPQPTNNLLCPNVMMICRHIHIIKAAAATILYYYLII